MYQRHYSNWLTRLPDEGKKLSDFLIIILGDFNRENLTHELPNDRQQIKCPSRDTSTLDHCYMVLKDRN